MSGPGLTAGVPIFGPRRKDRRWKLTPRQRVRYARGWLRWMLEGRPVDMPVVAEPGRLLTHPDGTFTITGFCFDCARMNVAASVSADDLWHRLSERYPIEHTTATSFDRCTPPLRRSLLRPPSGGGVERSERPGSPTGKAGLRPPGVNGKCTGPEGSALDRTARHQRSTPMPTTADRSHYPQHPPDGDLTDEELDAAARAGMGKPRDAGYCEVCHRDLQPGDPCPTCERADEGLR